MKTIATIGYTNNLYCQDQKTICYFEFQKMLEREVSDCLYWYASIHPREIEAASVEASLRLGLCIQTKLQENEKVLVIGGDLSGLCHVNDWFNKQYVLGVAGVEPQLCQTGWEKLLGQDVMLDFKSGLEHSPIGIWWPGGVNTESVALPPSLQVLYVPELIAKNDMVCLIDMLHTW